MIELDMRFDFERVLQLVNSETVLSMINKTSTRFKVYEGVRIGEIQAATNGDLSCWAWMSGENNMEKRRSVTLRQLLPRSRISITRSQVT